MNIANTAVHLIDILQHSRNSSTPLPYSIIHYNRYIFHKPYHKYISSAIGKHSQLLLLETQLHPRPATTTFERIQCSKAPSRFKYESQQPNPTQDPSREQDFVLSANIPEPLCQIQTILGSLRLDVYPIFQPDNQQRRLLVSNQFSNK